MPNTNPKTFARRLRDAVENRHSLDTPDLRAEAATDPTKDTAWRRQVLVESAIEAARSQPFEIDLTDAVLAELARSDKSELPSASPTVAASTGTVPDRRRQWAMPGSLLVAAAALLVAVLVVRGPGPRNDAPLGTRVAGDRPGDGLDPATRPEGEVVNPTHVASGDELDRLFSEAATAYRGLADETLVAMVDFGVLLPVGEVALPVPAPPTETPSWIDRVDGGLAPVRDNVGRTLEFLFEPVPADSTAT